jgi:hypothetical protein
MTKVLIVQPIFLPTKIFLEQQLRSLKSIKHIINDTVKFDYVFTGWAKTDELYDEFKDAVNTHIDGHIQIRRYARNMGKAEVVNDTIGFKNNNYDYMLTFDSDIVFEENTGGEFVDRIINVAEKSKQYTKKNFGLLSLNQKEGNCHIIKHIKHNDIKLDGNERIMWNNSPGHIAGGCVFISMENWNEIKGYTTGNVYGGHDGSLFNKTHKQNNSYFLLESLSVIHPRGTNKKYSIWKAAQHKKITNRSITFDEKIKNAEDFWDSK